MLLLALSLGAACRNKDLINYDSGGVRAETADSEVEVQDSDGDGVPDEDDCFPEDPERSETSTWYADADGDGYGDDGSRLELCEQPSGYSDVGGDCDDTDEAWHPGASEEDCSDPNDYNCDGSVGYSDEDGDGWPACEECDDSLAEVHPDAAEVCNGLDDDCDGSTDDEDVELDLSTAQDWFADKDADGYGDASESIQACEEPVGYVEDYADCDDTQSSVNPGATEVCNGVDDDCDALVDDEDGSLDASTGSSWYADSDGDGYGDSGASSLSCEQPSGSVSDATDCDDTDGDTNPGADEYCDGHDDDCDGDVDEDDAVDAGTWYPDSDGDGYGADRGSTEACDQPSSTVADNSDCDDSDADVNPGETEVCNEIDDDCDGDVDDADRTLDGSTASTWYDDDDGDGYGDSSASSAACDQPSGTVSDATDCDDTDGDVNPSESEICNGIDDDCDGDVDGDDGSVDLSTGGTWYTDGDGDGYGDSGSSTTACDQPSGSVSDSTDCDDTQSSVNPGETEICNEIDDDCDGDIDDDDSSVDLSTGDTFYLDSDGDGYGDSGSGAQACDAPSGYSDLDTDCDDSDSAVSPAGTESCNAVDDDCDGDVDDGGVCPCNVETYGSSTYLFCESSESWTDARDTCAGYGYTIATVDDASENSWMDSTADTYSTGKWWMGFNDRTTEGTFVWESGSSSTYTNWRSGEPNDSGGNEDCTQLNRYTDQTWNDEPCSSSFYYICET